MINHQEEQKFDVFTNFKHYGLPYPEIFVQDILKPVLRPNLKFDAIVCDPPYGIRHRSKGMHGADGGGADNFSVDRIYTALLEMGINHLKPGGRLVFLFHTDESVSAERN